MLGLNKIGIIFSENKTKISCYFTCQVNTSCFKNFSIFILENETQMLRKKIYFAVYYVNLDLNLSCLYIFVNKIICIILISKQLYFYMN